MSKYLTYCHCGNTVLSEDPEPRKCIGCWEKELKSHPESWEAYQNYWKEINEEYEKINEKEERDYNLLYEKGLL